MLTLTIFVKKLIIRFIWNFNSFMISMCNCEINFSINFFLNSTTSIFLQLRNSRNFVEDIFLWISMKIASWFESKLSFCVMSHRIIESTVFLVTKIKSIVIDKFFFLDLNVNVFIFVNKWNSTVFMIFISLFVSKCWCLSKSIHNEWCRLKFSIITCSSSDFFVKIFRKTSNVEISSYIVV